VADGCEVDITTNTAHCGACGRACALPNVAAYACSGGVCGIRGCSSGFADCNMNPADGCEVNLASNVSHCGVCGRVCPSGVNAASVCVSGSCRYVCASGYADCDGTATPGCETNLLTNLSHCGACGNRCVCTFLRPSCISGSCRCM
jgi:hypothetical protein